MVKINGANLTGYSLLPTTKLSLFEVAKVKVGMKSVIGDIRDIKSLSKLINKIKPEIIIHLAHNHLSVILIKNQLKHMKQILWVQLIF